MSSEVKDNVVAFPLGSVLNMEAEDLTVMSTAMREGITEMIVVGINEDGDLAVITPPTMETERTYYLLAKALNVVGEVGEETEEEDVEED